MKPNLFFSFRLVMCLIKFINKLYAGYHEMPQKVCERCIFHVRPYAFYFEMPQNRTLPFSVHFSVHFSISFCKWEKWGISKNSNIKNRGISKKKHVTSFKTRNEPKMKVFDFGASQNKMHMASREKTSFTYFLGHFMVPRVNAWNKIIESDERTVDTTSTVEVRLNLYGWFCCIDLISDYVIIFL